MLTLRHAAITMPRLMPAMPPADEIIFATLMLPFSSATLRYYVRC